MFPKTSLFHKKYCIAEDVPIVLYSGGLGKYRGLELLIRSFSLMDAKSSILIFMGDGPLEPRLKSFAKELGIKDRVIFNGSVPFDQVTKWIKGVTVGVHPMEGVNLNHQYALPNKFFEYLHAGVPVLTSDMFEMQKMVRKYNIGLTFKDTNVDSFTCALNEIVKPEVNSLKRKGISGFLTDVCWQKEQSKLLRLYQELVQNGRETNR